MLYDVQVLNIFGNSKFLIYPGIKYYQIKIFRYLIIIAIAENRAIVFLALCANFFCVPFYAILLFWPLSHLFNLGTLCCCLD